MRIDALPAAGSRIGLEHAGDVLASIRRLIAQDSAGCRIAESALNAIPASLADDLPEPEMPSVAQPVEPLILETADLVPSECPTARTTTSSDRTSDAEPVAPASLPPCAPTEETMLQSPTASVTALNTDAPPAAMAKAPEAASQAHLFRPIEGSEAKLPQLRGMIREAIRQELQGEIGGRLSQNIQAMIRHEVALALQQMCVEE